MKTKILELHSNMKVHVTREIHGKAIVRLELWEQMLNNIDSWSEGRLRFIHTELAEIYETHWIPIHTVWTKPHINEEMWENYEWMFDGKDVLEEQKLLKHARLAFKKRWAKFRADYKSFRESERAAKKVATEEGS